MSIFTDFSLIYCLFLTSSATAQIIPDNTLGNKNSIVVPNQTIRGINSDRIDGGAIRGNNLFHSFQEFNINNSQGVYFSNPENITNILTRITGNNLSNILGTLGVLGNANLFLMNPNGIVFGPNAQLDINGSFFASTADSILFENNIAFSASNPEAPPLLTINIPIGLNFRESQPTGTITNQGNLSISNYQTLGLIGGDIVLENSQITSEPGNIEIGSVGNNNIVKITNNENRFSFDYSEITDFRDIQLNESSVSVNSPANAIETSGDLNINARNLTLNNSAIETVTFGNPEGGNININANHITATGVANDPEFTIGNNQFFGGIRSLVTTNATGNTGNINIDTQQLTLQNGAGVGSFIRGTGESGNINVNAANIDITGTAAAESNNLFFSLFLSALNNQLPSGIFTLSFPDSAGNSGNITVNTENIILTDSGLISSIIFSQGDGGDITVNANNLEILAESNDFLFPSLIYSTVLFGATGNGGNITVNTNNLTATNGGQIRSGVSGVGNGGDITVRAKNSQFTGVYRDNFFSSGVTSTVDNLLGQQMSPQIANAVWTSRHQLLEAGHLIGQDLIATVLFTDIKGFSRITELTDSRTLMSWLNEYMNVMSQIVLDHDGVVDKFIGDAVMAVFGIPFPRMTPAEIDQDAIAAVRCAIEMKQQLICLNQHWQQRGLPTASMRVGIATGWVIAGSLGGSRRQNYTIIGDTVNIAARLEAHDKSIDDGVCRILISEETYQSVGDQFSTQLMGEVKLRGKEKIVSVYQVLTPTP